MWSREGCVRPSDLGQLLTSVVKRLHLLQGAIHALQTASVERTAQRSQDYSGLNFLVQLVQFSASSHD